MKNHLLCNMKLACNFANIDNENEILDDQNDESDNSRLIVYYTVSQVYSDSSKIDYNKKINDVDDSNYKRK